MNPFAPLKSLVCYDRRPQVSFYTSGHFSFCLKAALQLCRLVYVAIGLVSRRSVAFLYSHPAHRGFTEPNSLHDNRSWAERSCFSNLYMLGFIRPVDPEYSGRFLSDRATRSRKLRLSSLHDRNHAIALTILCTLPHNALFVRDFTHYKTFALDTW